MHGLRAEHFGGEGRDRATHEHVQLRDLGHRLDRFFKANASGQHRGETDLSVEAEAVMHGWPAKVGVDDKDAHVALREYAREVDGHRCFAFGRRRAGEKNHLWLTTGNGQQQRGAQRPEGFRELRLGTGECSQVAHRGRKRCLVRHAPPGARNERQGG